MRAQSASRYRIADLLVDLPQRRVTRAGCELALGKLTFGLLVALAERAPDVVSQEELAERVWRGRVVTPETVAQRVKMLRHTLGDDAKQPRYLRAVRGHGYQLVAEVEAVGPEEAGPLDAAARERSRPQVRSRQWAALTAFVLIGGAIAAWAYLNGTDQATGAHPPPHVIAVIPFTNASRDAAQDYFADGLSEGLIGELGRYDDVRLLGTQSAQLLKGTAEGYRSIGRRFGVEYVLTGTVRRSDADLEIFAELVTTEDGYVVWSERFARATADVFALQEEVARRVAGALDPSLGSERPEGLRGGTRNVAAYERYLRGRYLLERFEQNDAAVAELTEAVRLDPNFGLAYGVLAHAWRDAALDDASQVDEALEQSRAMAELALATAPDSATAHWVTAEEHAVGRRWIDADVAYRRAAELAGGGGDGPALFLLAAGRARAAIPEIEAIVADEPLLVLPQHWLAIAYEVLGDERAVEHYRAALALPGNHGAPEWVRFFSQLARGEIADPLHRLQQAPMFGQHFRTLKSLDDREAVRAAFHAAFAQRSGWSINAFNNFAAWASYVGEAELAVAAMRATLRLTPWFLMSVWLPVWQPTRADPAFKAFMQELGLSEYWRWANEWPAQCQPVGADDFECG